MKHLVFVMMLCVTAGVHAKGGGGGGHGGGHSSGHSSGSHSSGHSSSPHIYSAGHPSFGRSMRVTNNYYSRYGAPMISMPNFRSSDNDCKPPKNCEIKDYDPRF